MTLIYDPDEDLSSNFISARWQPSAGQNGVMGIEKVQYASQTQPAVIEETLSIDDPRGYFYDVSTGSGNPFLVMQTRKNCFIDIDWEFILYDGLMDSMSTTGATTGYVYTNAFSTNLTTPGRISHVWYKP